MMPNFLILGAFRAGTTALHYYLQQHPDVYMCPVKEPNFFALEGGDVSALGFPWPGDQDRLRELLQLKNSVFVLEDYERLFQGAPSHTVVGEASPWYLYSPRAADRILHYRPDAKLIVMLRQPVERAYSHYMQFVRYGFESEPDFERVLRAEEESIRNETGGMRHFLRMGFYYTQLQRYLERFDERNVRIYFYDDFDTNPIQVLKDIFRFLEVDDTFVPDVSVKFNASGAPRSTALDRGLRMLRPVKAVVKRTLPAGAVSALAAVQNRIQNRNLAAKPELSGKVRRALTHRYYKDEIMGLQDLTKRKLDAWLA